MPAASDNPDGSGQTICRWGAKCFNMDPEHRLRFTHPAPEAGALSVGQRRACKYGAGCYQKNPSHLEGYVHPGDRNYRSGLVVFGPKQDPEFESLWQLFQYYDPDETGHLSQSQFEMSVESCQKLTNCEVSETLEQAWLDADGPRTGFLSFRQFVTWTQQFLGLEYPLGLEVAGSSRPCRFRIMGEQGERCSCPAYTPAEGSVLCECGHKASMHRSDFAELGVTKFLEESCGERHWTPGEEGLVRIEDEAVLAKLQGMITATHKTVDNWTRDRGCLLHKVNGCAASCAFKNRVPVPSGYLLVGAYRNQNQDLWQKFSLMTRAAREDAKRQEEAALDPVSVATSGMELEGQPLEVDHNEWYLYHGSPLKSLKGICANNFMLSLAGSGSTWKDPGKDTGTPLYGYGIYLAEHITKADEYSEPIPPDDSIRPVDDPDVELHCVLLCRVFGGHTRVVTTNEFEVDKLRSDVFEGPFHSVFGDRVSTLGKPFREVVAYDKDQCYPEFLLVYTRYYE